MKRKITTLFLVAFAVLNVSLHAQSNPPRRPFSAKPSPSLSLNVGLVSSVLLVQDVYELRGRGGLFAGVIAKLPFSKEISLQPGLTFVQKGGRFEEYSYRNEGEHNVRLDYITLPFRLGVDIELDRDVALTFNGGVYVGYLLNTAYKLESSNGAKRREFDDIDSGLTAGMGFEYKRLVLGVNGDLGLADISKNEGGIIANFAMYTTIGIKF